MCFAAEMKRFLARIKCYLKFNEANATLVK